MEISGDTKQHLIRCCLLLSLNSSNRVRTGLHQQSQMILCQSLLSTKLFLIRLELHHTTSPSRYFLVRLLLKCSIKQCTKIPTATAYFPVLACVQSILCIKESYSARELDGQINSGYYERYILSKEKLLPEPIKGLKENPFLDSYVIEFLDLPKNFKESYLRKGLIQNMKEFILEVGKDFTFIDEEYRVQVGGEDFRIDLLFFHRGLKCLAAFELKIGKFKPEYISKMDFYLEALDCQKKENKNPSVGMILCASKDDEVVEHAMSRNMSPMMVAEYKLQLPDKAVLQELINMPLIKE